MLIYLRVARPSSGLAKTADSNGSNVSLLLPTDGTGTVFSDYSNANNSISSVLVSQGFMGPFNVLGAAQFQGNGYLDLGEAQTVSLGLGDYTLDTWLYSDTLAGTQNILWLNGNDASGNYCAINLLTINDQLALRCSYEGLQWDINLPTLETLTAATWQYFSLQKKDNYLTIYLDGHLLETVPITMPLMSGTVNFVGAGSAAQRNFMIGDVTELRLSKGVTRYDGEISDVPIAPSGTDLGDSTDIHAADVSMLIHFNDVYGVDVFTEECSNKITAFKGTSDAPPVLSNYASKFGGTSGQFSGGNYIELPPIPNYGLPGDFTLEFFVNFHAPVLVNKVLYVINSLTNGLNIQATTTGLSVLLINVEKGTGAISGFSWTINTWHHVCLVRTNGILEVYINGARRSRNITATASVPTGYVWIGSTPTTAFANGFTGNIDELRLTKNVARYNNTFTVPAAPLPSTVATTLLLSGTVLGDSSSVALPVGTNVIQMDPFNNGTYSYLGNGTSDALATVTSLAFNYGTGNFTIEGWFNPSAIPTWLTGTFYLFDHGSAVGALSYVAGKLSFVGTSTHTTITVVTVPQNAWNHIAVVRATGVLKIFLNGVSLTLTTSASTWNPTTTQILSIGKRGTVLTNNFQGLISNFRVNKGNALYSSNFTPPTSPLTAVAGTVLLTCQTNPIVDTSVSALALTLTNITAPTLVANTPFASAAGGSMSFNGTSDRLSVFNGSQFTFGTNDFGVEFWFNFNTLATAKGIVGNKFTATQTTGVWSINITTGNKIQLTGWSTVILVSLTTLAANTWYHVSFQRINGQLSLFLNGVMEVASTVNFPTNLNVTSNLQIGWDSTGYYRGYLSNLRITSNGVSYIVGDQVPTTQFPTVPLLNANPNEPYLQNVSLQLDGESLTNDAFGAAILSQVGTVALSFGAKQSGSSSMHFTGDGYLTTLGNNALQFVVADFTVEAWVYLSDLSHNKQIILDFRNDPATSTEAYLTLFSSTGAEGQSNCFSWYAGGQYYSTSGVDLITGYWYHVAVSRASGTTRVFINGTTRASGIDLINYKSGLSMVTIGAGVDGNLPYYGCIDGVRVTKAASRYTANFMVPKGAFTTGTYGNDPYAASVSVYLTGDGANNSIENIDSSINALTPLMQVSPSFDLQPTGPFASSNWSALFNSGDGTTTTTTGISSVVVNYDPLFSLLAVTTPYTIEMWVNPTSVANGPVIATMGSFIWNNGSTPGYQWLLQINTANKLVFTQANGSTDLSNIVVTSTANVALNTWTHVAVVRTAAKVITLYVNGVASGTFTDTTPSISYTATSLSIGGGIGSGLNGNCLSGSISNFRMVNGTAVYTAGFTPSTVPLTAIANTVLLTLQNSSFVDNSPNGFRVTPWLLGGGTGWPLNLTANVGPSAQINYSGFFTNGSLINAPANAAYALATSATWTIETWVMPTAFSFATNSVIAGYTGAFNGWNTTTGVQWVLYVNTGGQLIFTFNAGGSAVTITSTKAIAIHSWSHIAVVRNAGTITLYVNGKVAGTSASVPSTTTTPTTFSLGGSFSGANLFYGYISNFRIVKDAVVYTGVFTPPIAKLTAITGTTLLAFTDASPLVDRSTTGAVFVPMGYAQSNNAIYRNGNASLALNNHRISYADSPLFQFGTGAFTIEFWIYRTSAAIAAIFSKKRLGSANAGYMDCTISAAHVISLASTQGTAALCTLNGLNTWQHVAIVKTDTNLLCFLDGQQTYNAGNAYNFTATDPFRIGNNGTYFAAGYLIDDFRVTKGVAKYIGNFSLTQSPNAPGLFVSDPVVTQPADQRAVLTASWDPVPGTTFSKVYVSNKPSILAGTRIVNGASDTTSTGLAIGSGILTADTNYFVAPIATSNIGGDSKIGDIAVVRSGPVTMPRNLSVSLSANNYVDSFVKAQTAPFSSAGYNSSIQSSWNGISFHYSTVPGVIPGAQGVQSLLVSGPANALGTGHDNFDGSPFISSTKKIAGLQPDTDYYLTATTSGLSPYNSGGTSKHIAEVKFKTPALPTVPTAPTGLTVVALDPYTFQITWNTAANVDSYTLYGARTNYAGGVSPVNGFDYSQAGILIQAGATNTFLWVNAFPITTVDTASYFSIAAVNTAGSSAASAQVTANSLTNPVATSVALGNAGPNTVRITWPASPANVTGVLIIQSQTSGFNETNYTQATYVQGAGAGSVLIPMSGPSQVWYTRLVYVYRSTTGDSGFRSRPTAQIASNTTAMPAIAIGTAADSTRNRITINFTPTWNVNDSYTVYGSQITPCLGNEQIFASGNASGLVFESLEAGKTYYFYMVVNYHNGGTSVASGQVSGVCAGTAVLTSPTVVATYPTQARFSWALPTLTNIPNYYVIMGIADSLANANAHNYNVVTLTTRAFMDPNLGPRGGPIGQPEILSHFMGGLSPSTTYYIRFGLIRQDINGSWFGANISTGLGMTGAVAITTKSGSLPGAPGNMIAAKSVGTPRTSVVLNWTKTPSATGYVITRRALPDDSTAPGMYRAVSYTVGDVATTTINDCRPGVRNFFVIQAISAGGQSDISGEVYVDMDPNVTIPVPTTSAPANPYNERTVNWTAWAGDGGVTGYRLYVKKVSEGLPTAGNNLTFNTPYMTVGNVLTATLTGLENGTDYYVCLEPFNTTYGPTYEVSAPATFTTSIPAAMTGIVSAPVITGASGVVSALGLTWGAVAGALQYAVYISKTATPVALNDSSRVLLPSTALTYQWNSLISDTTYYASIAVQTVQGWSLIAQASPVKMDKIHAPYRATAKLSTTNKKYGTGSIRIDYDSNSKGLIANPIQGFDLGNDSFTIDGWVYLDGTSVIQELICKCNPNKTVPLWRIYVAAGGEIRFDASSAGVTNDIANAVGFGTIPTATWVFISIVRSVNDYKLFLNGVLNASFTNAATFANYFGPLNIGSNEFTAHKLAGNLDDLRITKGIARYVSAFTPPAGEPFIVTPADPFIQAVSLLLHSYGNDGNTAFTDKSLVPSVLTSVNGAAMRSFRNRYSQYSINLPSANSAISMPANSKFALSTKNFALEAWVFITDVVNPFNILSTDGASPDFAFRINTAGALTVWNGSAHVVLGGAVAPNTWTHIAFIRSFGTVTGYVNTQSVGSTALTTNFASTQVVKIGATATVSAGTGYLTEVRLTKGTARPVYLSATIAPDSSMCDPYWANVQLMLTGNPQDGFPFVVDSANKVSMIASGFAADLVNYNRKNQAIASWPEYAYSQGYVLYWSTSPNVGLPGDTATQSVTVATALGVPYATQSGVSSITQAAIKTLVAGTTYYFRYRVYTIEGLYTDLSETLTVTTDAIPAPTATVSLQATVPTKSSITVNWDAYNTLNAAPTGFNVHYSTDSGFATSTKVVVAGGTTYTRILTGLLANTTYYVRVTVNTVWGESTYSNTPSLKTTLT